MNTLEFEHFGVMQRVFAVLGQPEASLPAFLGPARLLLKSSASMPSLDRRSTQLGLSPDLRDVLGVLVTASECSEGFIIAAPVTQCRTFTRHIT